MTVLSFREVEKRAAEAAQDLAVKTGAVLPALVGNPQKVAERMALPLLGLSLPRGELFYPCCGGDTAEALKWFAESVAGLRFADPYRPPFGCARPRDTSATEVAHIGTVVCGESTQQTLSSRKIEVYGKDGVLTLIDDIAKLSVFFYRGDSYGEGGSNQRWLEPGLFHSVLARLVDGGLIVTDGSNCGSGRYGQRVPWSAICDPSRTDEAFHYAGRHFVLAGELVGARHQPVRAWQVVADE